MTISLSLTTVLGPRFAPRIGAIGLVKSASAGSAIKLLEPRALDDLDQVGIHADEQIGAIMIGMRARPGDLCRATRPSTHFTVDAKPGNASAAPNV